MEPIIISLKKKIALEEGCSEQACINCAINSGCMYHAQRYTLNSRQNSPSVLKTLKDLLEKRQ